LSAQSFEITLARLYTDPVFRNRFLENSEKSLVGIDLSAAEKDELLAIDRAGLLMASRSFLNKRKKRFGHHSRLKLLTKFVCKGL
jgi:hypothetical protein